MVLVLVEEVLVVVVDVDEVDVLVEVVLVDVVDVEVVGATSLISRFSTYPVISSRGSTSLSVPAAREIYL